MHEKKVRVAKERTFKKLFSNLGKEIWTRLRFANEDKEKRIHLRYVLKEWKTAQWFWCTEVEGMGVNKDNTDLRSDCNNIVSGEAVRKNEIW